MENQISMKKWYEEVSDELTKRILDLIPNNPQILSMDSPWGLFRVKGFKCDDIGPSMAQASFALRDAVTIYREGKK